MFSLFGKPKDTRTPQEKYDDMKKGIRENIRAIDRQIRALEREMKKMDMDIKKAAKNKASPAILKAKCKSRVSLQKGIEKLISVRANTESVLTTITIQRAHILQSNAMKNATLTMRAINEGMGAEEMQAVCMEFQKEMMKNELMGQVIDEITFGEEEELVDEEVAKVLREVAGEETANLVLAGAGGIQQATGMAQPMSSLPTVPN